MLQRLIVIVLAFLGNFIGRWLAALAPEEIPLGTRYFLFSKKILLVILALLLLLQIPALSFSLLFFVFIGGLLGYAFRQQHFFLGLALIVTSFLSTAIFFIAAVIALLYGIIASSIKRQPALRLFFFFVPLLLLVFPSFVTAHLITLLAVTIGALLASALYGGSKAVAKGAEYVVNKIRSGKITKTSGMTKSMLVALFPPRAA